MVSVSQNVKSMDGEPVISSSIPQEDENKGDSKLGTGGIVGIVIAVIAITIVAVISIFIYMSRKRNEEKKDILGIEIMV